MTMKVPTKLSWNCKKAERLSCTNLLENELHTSPLNFNPHPDKLCNEITNIMIRCTKNTISRGKAKHYGVFWSEHLEKPKESGTPFATQLIGLKERKTYKPGDGSQL
ncbi:unnamed protein product [Rodentolepis nana]|uniref:Ovule protein n=1 Tax=Rodentolepis nana TaxID=102285 RepID=A0A0R3TAG5_RODNA|nr:unnamed protein product [Rodentolepis nana]